MFEYFHTLAVPLQFNEKKLIHNNIRNNNTFAALFSDSTLLFTCNLQIQTQKRCKYLIEKNYMCKVSNLESWFSYKCSDLISYSILSLHLLIHGKVFLLSHEC